ncbi:TPA: hypothetical protein ACGO7Y_000473, partial [Streptococcus suis]
MVAGTFAGGFTTTDTVLAEDSLVQTQETKQELLATTDTVELGGSASLVQYSEVVSQSMLELVEESVILSSSPSESIPDSHSLSLSESESHYDIVSTSESISESISNSEILLLSESGELVKEVADSAGSARIELSSTISEQPSADLAGLNRQLFDIALVSLEEARSLEVPDALDKTTTKYQRYIRAKEAADQAWQLVKEIQAGKIVSQEELDAASKQIAQAATNLTGRRTQLLGGSGKVGTSLRATSGDTILVFSESDANAKLNGTQISLIEGRLDTTTNLIDWKVIYNPITSLSQAYAGLYVAAVTEMGEPQNILVNGIPLHLDNSFNSRETLGVTLRTVDYSGRYYGKNYSLAESPISTSGPVTYTFTTRVSSSLANIAMYVQAAIHPTSNVVHATVKEPENRQNLSGMLIGYRTSFVADGMNSFLQSTSESIQNSLSIRLSLSQSHSQSVSVSNSLSQSGSKSLSMSLLTSYSESLSESASESASTFVSTSASESVSASVSTSFSESLSESISTSVSESLSESVSTSVSESVSVSVSTSVSESLSESVSTSISESVSTSFSESLSESVSMSVSESISASVSTSISESVSESVSTSFSESLSASVSTSV